MTEEFNWDTLNTEVEETPNESGNYGLIKNGGDAIATVTKFELGFNGQNSQAPNHPRVVVYFHLEGEDEDGKTVKNNSDYIQKYLPLPIGNISDDLKASYSKGWNNFTMATGLKANGEKLTLNKESIAKYCKEGVTCNCVVNKKEYPKNDGSTGEKNEIHYFKGKDEDKKSSPSSGLSNSAPIVKEDDITF